MGFASSLSGLGAAENKMAAASNNIANASTVGYKQSPVQFADVYASSLVGAGAAQIGIGVRLSAVRQQFTQGNITPTENPLDIAINGNGFFRMSTDGEITYTRTGQFKLSKDGFI